MRVPKLFSLKSWLTLEEAADHLSCTLQEPVTVPDLLRLAIDGHLVLSAHFVNHASANFGKKVTWDDARLVLFPDLSQMKSFELEPEVAALLKDFQKNGTRQEQHEWLTKNRAVSEHPKIIISISGDRVADGVLEWSREVVSIDGIWDLPTCGSAALDVAHLLQSLVGGPEITLTCLDGTFVVSQDGLTYARLLEHYENNPYVKDAEGMQDRIARIRKYPYGDPKSYYPSGGLPEDAPIVVRPAALTAFLTSFVRGNSETVITTEKPLDDRERTSLLCIIGALASNAHLDLSQPHKAGAVVAAMLPGEVKLSARTIGEHLKGVREAMDSRKG